MQSVDLSLAISYVPAALCLLRLVIYLVGVTCLHPGEEIGGLMILAHVLYLDRLAFSMANLNTIFDSNAVLLAVFFSHVYLFIRNANTELHLSFLGTAVNVWWAACCIALIAEPARMRAWAEERGRVFQFIPPCIMAVSLITLSRVHAEREDGLSRFARGFAFALLSIVWVYVVGIKKKLQLDHSNHFISRFAPVLYLPSYACGIFAVLAVAAVAYQYYKLFILEREPEARLLPVTAPPPQQNHGLLTTIKEDAEPDMEEMFRLARQSKFN